MTTPVDPGRTSAAAERDAIESAIAGGTLLTAFAETSESFADVETYRWQQAGGWRSLTYWRTLSGPSPDPSPARAFASSARAVDVRVPDTCCGHRRERGG